jgi:hypothetical protein
MWDLSAAGQEPDLRYEECNQVYRAMSPGPPTSSALFTVPLDSPEAQEAMYRLPGGEPGPERQRARLDVAARR